MVQTDKDDPEVALMHSIQLLRSALSALLQEQTLLIEHLKRQGEGMSSAIDEVEPPPATSEQSKVISLSEHWRAGKE